MTDKEIFYREIVQRRKRPDGELKQTRFVTVTKKSSRGEKSERDVEN